MSTLPIPTDADRICAMNATAFIGEKAAAIRANPGKLQDFSGLELMIAAHVAKATAEKDAEIVRLKEQFGAAREDATRYAGFNATLRTEKANLRRAVVLAMDELHKHAQASDSLTKKMRITSVLRVLSAALAEAQAGAPTNTEPGDDALMT